MKLKIYPPLAIVFLLIFSNINILQAQQVSEMRDSHYLHALDLFEKGLYTDASLQFRKAAESCAADNYILQSNIAAYSALCAIRLQQPGSEKAVIAMEQQYGDNPQMNTLYFALARQYCNEENYSGAIHWFEKTDNRDLEANDRTEALFLQGYAYFKADKYDKAQQAFTTIKHLPKSRYTNPAVYYSAHIDYNKRNYVSALEAFKSIRNDERFTVPAGYYILQIYALRANYSEVIREGAVLLKTASDSRYAEIARLMAEAAFHTRQYPEAAQYFNQYKSKTAITSRNDQFFEAAIHYQLKQYTEACTGFKNVIGNNKDSLDQAAAYYIADAALKTDNKQEALNYFGQARLYTYNPEIQQEAWTSYIKLAMELNGDSRPLEQYRQAYPGKDISRLSATAYILAKQYDKALSVLQSLPGATAQDKAYIQRVSFAQGITLYEKQDYQAAINAFDLSLQYAQYDTDIALNARYWKAESLYQKGDYNNARKLYEACIHATGAGTGEAYRMSHYNIAYCYYKQKNYSEAATWFRKFVALADVKIELQGNAHSRTGDCYFMQKRYPQAVEHYDKAISLNAWRSDYALFQKGVAQGLIEGKQGLKIATLTTLCDKYPGSDYAPAAFFEIGRTYVRNNDFDKAAKAYTAITGQYRESPYNQAALLELGLISVNTGKNKEAIDYYKKAVQANPTTPEAKNALAGLKTAYIEDNDAEGYISFTESLGDLSTGMEAEKEEARFTVAEKNYLEGNYKNAVTLLTTFLQTYPKSQYGTQANFYLGDCSYRSQAFRTAKDCFETVVNRPRSSFTEPALSGLAKSNQALELYDEAAAAYAQLYASSDDQEYYLKGTLLKAKARDRAGEEEEALRLYRELSGAHIQTAEGAEAAYLSIAILYRQKKNEEAINAVFDLSGSKTPQQYWVARSFILLGDLYAGRQELEQAKATYESVRNNYKHKDDDIIATVEQRLAALE